MPWSPTPGAETLGNVKKQAAGYCLMPTDDEVLETAEMGVRRAIDRLNTRAWSWLLAYDDIAFVVGQTEYPLSSWFKAPRNFELWNTSSQAIDRLSYKPWKTFLTEHQDVTAESVPCVYSCPNVNKLGTVTLNSAPSADWVSKYPSGRLWYFRKVEYPVGAGTAIGVPSEAIGFVQEHTDAYTADRYAVAKAQAAYQRAERFHHELVVDDAHGGQTDWE